MRGTWIAVFLFALALWPKLARAQATDRVLAEALFREGRELMEQDKLSEACGKFGESYKLDRALGTLINLALCHEKEGKVATAWAEFTEAASEATAEKDDREAFARKHIATLQAELPRFRITVDPAAASLGDLEIKIDGHSTGKAAWSTALPIDPGVHELEANATGKVPFKAKVTIPKGAGVTEQKVPALSDQPVAPLATDGSEEKRGRNQRVAGFTITGIGVVGVVIGAAYGVSAISLKDERDQHCSAADGFCDPTGVEKDGEARDAATISTVALIAGGVLVVGGVILTLVAPKAKVNVTGSTAGRLLLGGTF